MADDKKEQKIKELKKSLANLSPERLGQTISKDEEAIEEFLHLLEADGRVTVMPMFIGCIFKAEPSNKEKLLDLGISLLKKHHSDERCLFELLEAGAGTYQREWVRMICERFGDGAADKHWSRITHNYLKTPPDSALINGLLDAGLDTQKVNEKGNKPLREFMEILKRRDEFLGGESNEDILAEEKALILRMAEMGKGMEDMEWVRINPEKEFEMKEFKSLLMGLREKGELAKESTRNVRSRTKKKL